MAHAVWDIKFQIIPTEQMVRWSTVQLYVCNPVGKQQPRISNISQDSKLSTRKSSSDSSVLLQDNVTCNIKSVDIHRYTDR